MGKKRDHTEDFRDFCDLWSKACEDGIFDDAPALPPPQLGDGLAAKMGIYDDLEEDQEEPDGDEAYYSYMAGTETEDDLLQEETKRSKKVTPNPIYPDSAGADMSRPRPVWVEMDAFEKIDELKRKLYDIECKLGEDDAGGKKWNEKVHQPGGKKLLTQIESLKKQIDDLSDSLGLEDEPDQSMWQVGERNK
jgi:hypothetical protein